MVLKLRADRFSRSRFSVHIWLVLALNAHTLRKFSILIHHNMSDTPEPGGIALGLPSAAVLFFVWAFLFYLARIWSKLGKDDLWGADGTLISLAMVTNGKTSMDQDMFRLFGIS